MKYFCDGINPYFVCLLFQAAWQEVQQSLVELSQTRSRVQRLKSLLQARKTEAEQELSGTLDELHNETMALYVHWHCKLKHKSHRSTCYEVCSLTC